MTKEKFAKILIEALYENDDLEIESVNSYQEAGVLTLDTGFVVRLDSGDIFYVTITDR